MIASKKFHALSVVILVLLGILIYSNSLHVLFQFDDKAFIENNLTIRNIDDIAGIWNYLAYPNRFIAFYTFALNYQFSGLDVTSYHAVNLGIHIGNAILVYWLSLLLLQAARVSELIIRKTHLISLFAALLFLTHPIQTQAVTYLSQRFASLATLFYLASVCCYLKGRINSNNNWGYFVASICFAVLGMFTKQITFTLPFIILLMEVMFFQKTEPVHRGLRKFWMMFSFLILVIPVCFLLGTGKMPFQVIDSHSHLGDKISWFTYGLTQLRVIAHYIRLMFVPFGQNLDYDFPLSQSLFEPVTTLLSAAFLISILVIGFRLRARHSIAAFGIFWFFITHLVESSIIPIRHVIFEHRVYLPSVGFCLIASYSIVVLAKNWKSAIAVGLIIVTLFSIFTFQRNRVWANEFTLWEDVLKKSPQKTRPHIYLGLAYLEQNDIERAYDHLNRAVEIDPQLAEGYNNRGIVYKKRGEYALALNDFTKAIELNAYYADAFYNRANTYSHLERHDEAIDDFTRVIDLSPTYDAAYYNRANAYNRKGDYAKAVMDYTYFIGQHADMAEAFYGRGIAYLNMGNKESALGDFKRAQALGHGQSAQHINVITDTHH